MDNIAMTFDKKGLHEKSLTFYFKSLTIKNNFLG
jgi:hypothetical protein